MMPKSNRFEMHSFYCLTCGNKTFDLPRQYSHMYGKGHIKDLYCPTCRTTRKTLECRNETEVFEFKEDFLNGVYEDSVDTCGAAGLGEIDLARAE